MASEESSSSSPSRLSFSSPPSVGSSTFPHLGVFLIFLVVLFFFCVAGEGVEGGGGGWAAPPAAHWPCPWRLGRRGTPAPRYLDAVGRAKTLFLSLFFLIYLSRARFDQGKGWPNRRQRCTARADRRRSGSEGSSRTHTSASDPDGVVFSLFSKTGNAVRLERGREVSSRTHTYASDPDVVATAVRL